MQNNQQIEYISANSNTIIPKLQPSLQNWVNQSFGSINPLQAATTPLISKRKSALIMAPTGSGKTLSVFLGILDSLLLLEKKSKLKKKIYVIYISPLKALNNDIHKNLEIPLQHLRDDLHSEISIGTRTGDTTPKERNFLLRNPPHILITTPESLGLLITSPKFKEHLKQIDWVICDEIHSIAGNKRGTFLSLILEHLNYLTDKQFARVGLSATINPPKTIARFLMGNRKQRILIVQIETQRIMEVAAVSPVEDFLRTPFSKIQESQLNIIEERIRNNRTTLIFANTRHMSERLFYHLEKRIKDPNMLISIHHGSLDKKLRLSVEENLKKGRVSAVFTSTSLELGIDIGTIDHVVQMGSPKSVSSLLQRIGRSGHTSNLVSKGTLIAYNRDDLIESVAIAKLAIENQIDKLFIPDKPLDVLLQILVGLTLEKKWSTKAAYNLVKKSYPYRDLTYNEFRDIVIFASNPTQNDDGWKYSHIWYDPETDLFGRRRSARVAFFQNIGTIPPTSSIQVLLEGFRSRVGNLTERFAEKLNPGDIFILSGRTLQYLRPIEDKIVVREVFGKLPTVPSWSGEGLARTREISREISDILSSIEEKIESKTSKTDLIEWIVGRYPTGKLEATIIYDYVLAQVSISRVPKFNNLVIEKFVDHDGSENIIVLSLHGKKVNSLLGQALAGYYAKITGSNIAHTSTDNGFLLKFPFGAQFDHEGLFSQFSVDQLEESLVFGLRQTEIFKLRFRHAANRSLMVISKRGRFNSSFQDQRRLSRWLIRTMHPESIVAKEAMREIFYDTFDLTSARDLISKINSHKIKLHFQPVNNFPSPMSYAILFNSYVDVVFMEDRRNLLLGLHQQVLSRLLPASENEQQSLDPKLIKKYFHEKIHIESTNDPEVITELFSRYNLNNASFLKNASKKTGIDEHDIKHLMASNREILDAGSEKWVSLNYLPYFLAYNPEIVIAEDPSQDELLQAAYKLTKQISPDEGISTIAKAALEFEGPLNLKELSTITGIETGRLEKIIYKLVGNYEILKGSFLSSQEEYLLRQDRDRIFGLSNNALDQINTQQLSAFRNNFILQKTFPEIRHDNHDIFSELIHIRDPLEFFSRKKPYPLSRFRRKLYDQEIYHGRFLGGKYIYIDAAHLETFQIVYRQNNELSHEEQEILEIVSIRSGISHHLLKKLVKTKKYEITQILRQLENKLYISKIDLDYFATTRSQVSIHYVALPKTSLNSDDRQQNIQKLLMMLFVSYGILTLEDILRITRIEYELVEIALSKLSNRIVSFEILSQLYYGLNEQFEDLKANRIAEDLSPIIISPKDRFFSINSSSFIFENTQWSRKLLILQNGSIVGQIIYNLTDRAALQITNLQLNQSSSRDISFLSRLVTQILKLATEILTVNAIFVESINLKPLNHLENDFYSMIFANQGFVLVIDRLVWSKNNDNRFDDDDISKLSYQLLKARAQKFDSLSNLMQKIQITDISKIRTLLNLPAKSLQLEISAFIRKGDYHFMDGKLYSNHLWSTFVNPDPDEGDMKLQFEGIQSLHQLAEKLAVDTVSAQKILYQKVKSRQLELISPFGFIREYRVFKAQEDLSLPIKVARLILFIIQSRGPTSFATLHLEIKEYISSISRIDVLINLVDFMKNGLMTTCWILHNGKPELAYLTKEQLENLQTHNHEEDIGELELIKSDSEVNHGFSRKYNYLIFSHGILIGAFKFKRTGNAAIVQELVFLSTKITKVGHILEEFISELENLTKSNSLTKLQIEKINDNAPSFWNSLIA